MQFLTENQGIWESDADMYQTMKNIVLLLRRHVQNPKIIQYAPHNLQDIGGCQYRKDWKINNLNIGPIDAYRSGFCCNCEASSVGFSSFDTSPAALASTNARFRKPAAVTTS